MSETVHHLVIPFASVSSEAAAKYVQGLKLPHLRQLFDVLTLVDSDIGTEESFSPPHERALARVQGLPVDAGCIPWAAQKATALGLEVAQTQFWGFVTLCHSVVGNGSMTMKDPAELQVSEAESRQLLADMLPYFAEDGLTLHYLEPTLWLCCGELLRGVRTASLDRVVGKGLADWQPAGWQPIAEPSQDGSAPSGGNAAKLRRLQNEMQMLLYIHAVNNTRNTGNREAINSIWLHGTGDVLDLIKTSEQVKVNTNINMPRSLLEAALKEDWPAWAKAWEQLDATVCADLLKRVQAGESVVLTLCGERSALRYELRQKGAWERLKDSFRGILGLQPSYLLPELL